MKSFNDADDIVQHIFAADPLAVLKYEESHAPKRGLADPGPRRLMLAVLEDAIGCYQARFFKPSRINEIRSREAEEWIASDSEEPFSFNGICDSLWIDPDWLRNKLFGWKEDRLRDPTKTLCRLLPKKGKSLRESPALGRKIVSFRQQSRPA